MSVAGADGALVSLPTQFASDGEILANASDPSVTCYNMAMAAVYESERTPADPAAVFVRFGNDTVSVPISFREARTSGGDTTITGSGIKTMMLTSAAAGADADLPAGMLVDARIVVVGGVLSDAVFDEATVVGSPAKPISRMTCSLASGTKSPTLPVASDTKGA